MKKYSMIGNNIGIEVCASNAVEAMEIAETILSHGLGVDVSFCNKEDKEEYKRCQIEMCSAFSSNIKKIYPMVGNNVGIEVYAKDAAQAEQTAQESLSCGLGADISFCNEEDKEN